MPFIDTLLQKYPGYKPEELASAWAKKYGISIKEAYDQIEYTPPTVMGELKAGVKQGLASYPVGAGQLLEDAGWKDNPVLRYGQEVQQANPTSDASQSWEGFKEHPILGAAGLLGQGIGSTLPGIIPFLGPAAKVGAEVGLVGRSLAAARSFPVQTALYGVPSYGANRQEQIQEGVPTDLMAFAKAGGAALVQGAIERGLGAQRLLGKTTDVALTGERALISGLDKTPIRSGIGTWLRTGAEEALEEGLQQPLQQLSADKDPLTEASLRDTGWNMFGGLIGGLGLGVASGGRMGLAHAGIRNELRQDMFIAPDAGTPTDLLQGLARQEQYNDVQGRWQTQADFDQATPAPEVNEWSDPEAYAYQQGLAEQKVKTPDLSPDMQAAIVAAAQRPDYGDRVKSVTPGTLAKYDAALAGLTSDALELKADKSRSPAYRTIMQELATVRKAVENDLAQQAQQVSPPEAGSPPVVSPTAVSPALTPATGGTQINVPGATAVPGVAVPSIPARGMTPIVQQGAPSVATPAQAQPVQAQQQEAPVAAAIAPAPIATINQGDLLNVPSQVVRPGGVTQVQTGEAIPSGEAGVLAAQETPPSVQAPQAAEVGYKTREQAAQAIARMPVRQRANLRPVETDGFWYPTAIPPSAARRAALQRTGQMTLERGKPDYGVHSIAEYFALKDGLAPQGAADSVGNAVTLKIPKVGVRRLFKEGGTPLDAHALQDAIDAGYLNEDASLADFEAALRKDVQGVQQGRTDLRVFSGRATAPYEQQMQDEYERAKEAEQDQAEAYQGTTPVVDEEAQREAEAERAAMQAEGGIPEEDMSDVSFDEAPTGAATAEALGFSEMEVAQQEFKDAAADVLAAIAATSPYKTNLTPEQHAALGPALVKLFDAAARLGILKFKDAVNHVRRALGKLADKISLGAMKAAYLEATKGMEGADSAKVVAKIAYVAPEKQARNLKKEVMKGLAPTGGSGIVSGAASQADSLAVQKRKEQSKAVSKKQVATIKADLLGHKLTAAPVAQKNDLFVAPEQVPVEQIKNPEHREAVAMFEEGATLREIAETLGTPAEAVTSDMFGDEDVNTGKIKTSHVAWRTILGQYGYSEALRAKDGSQMEVSDAGVHDREAENLGFLNIRKVPNAGGITASRSDKTSKQQMRKKLDQYNGTQTLEAVKKQVAALHRNWNALAPAAQLALLEKAGVASSRQYGLHKTIGNLLFHVPLDAMKRAILFGPSALYLRGVNLGRDVSEVEILAPRDLANRINEAGVKGVAAISNPAGMTYEEVRKGARLLPGSNGLQVATVETAKKWMTLLQREKDVADLSATQKHEEAKKPTVKQLTSEDVRNAEQVAEVLDVKFSKSAAVPFTKTGIRVIYEGKPGTLEGIKEDLHGKQTVRVKTPDGETGWIDAGKVSRPQYGGTGQGELFSRDMKDRRTNDLFGMPAKLIRDQLKGFFYSGNQFDDKVTVVQTADKIPARLRTEGFDESVSALTDGKHVWMIADRLAPGESLSIFLHEVGAHMGMKNLIGEERYYQLLAQIEMWERFTEGTVESDLARAARRRVEQAKTPAKDVDDELLAYFVSEAVDAGIDPTALHKIEGPVKEWFKSLMSAVKSALRKFGVNIDKLTAKDIVDLAYGAAQLELDNTRDGGAQMEVKFSKSAAVTALPEAQKFTSLAAAGMFNRIRNTAADLSAKALNAVVFLHDLVDIAEKAGLKTAKGFHDLMGEKDQVRNRMEERIDQIMQRASQLEDQKAAEQFLHDSTISRQWGYDNNPDKTASTPAMKARFDALTKESQAVVREVFQEGADTYAELRRLADLEVNREYDELVKRYPQKAADLNKDRASTLSKQARALPKWRGPYAPLKRFGDHVVVARSQQYVDAEKAHDQKTMNKLIAHPTDIHYVVEFYDTAGAAIDRATQLEPLFPSVVASNKQESYQKVDELPWSGIAKIKSAIHSSPNEPYKESMERLVTNLYLQMLAESSARKAALKRQGVAGAADMFRAFAAHGRSSAHFIASLTKGTEISRQITAMKNESHNAPGETRNTATRVYNEIAARYAQGLDYKETPWVDKALRVSSVYMLLTSPAYFLQNATQTYMIALPVLGGRYHGRAFTEINRAYGDVAKYVGKMGHELDVSKLPITPAERAMLISLRDKGKLDITIASDLGRWASGAADQGVIGRVVNKMYSAAGKVEALNRITTALAAYRLSGSEKYAGDVVDLTQGNYSANNAPRFFRANGGAKLITQFRKYQLIQISLLGRLLHDSFAGASAEEKAVARRAFAWLFTQQLVFTGVKGLPIPAVLLMLTAALGGDDDKDWERNFRKVVGEDIATLLLKGVPAWMGLDLSNRIGMGNAFSVLPFSDIDFTKAGYKEAVFGASGAFIGGVGGQLFDGLDKMNQGHYYKGVEALMPRGLRDAMAGYRMATEGITTGRGDSVLAPDEISFFAGMMKAVGMPTTAITEFQTGRNDLYELGDHFTKRDQALKDKYAHAAKEHDGDTMASVREEWKAEQESKKRWIEEMSQRGFKDRKLLEHLKPQPLGTLLKAPAALAKREAPWARAAQARSAA